MFKNSSGQERYPISEITLCTSPRQSGSERLEVQENNEKQVPNCGSGTNVTISFVVRYKVCVRSE